MAEGSQISPEDLGLDVPGIAGDQLPGQDAKETLNLREARKNLEREIVSKALEKHQGKVASAAAELGVARPTFYDLMDRLEISKA